MIFMRFSLELDPLTLIYNQKTKDFKVVERNGTMKWLFLQIVFFDRQKTACFV